MSRSARDLRELICISRLSIREDESSEDDDDENPSTRDNSSLIRECKSRSNQARFLNNYQNNGSVRDRAAATEIFNAIAEKNKGTIPPSCNERSNEIVVGRPKSAVGGMKRPTSAAGKIGCNDIEHASQKQSKNDDVMQFDENKSYSKCSEGCDNYHKKDCKVKKSFDYEKIEQMLQYIDANVISNWLERCNHDLDKMVKWLKGGHNFVNFANFMINHFHYSKRKELINMEASFILNEFELAFQVGIRDKKLRIEDLDVLLQVVLKEYPKKLIGRKGSFHLLKALLTFCCGRNESYKKLLSDVRFSTCNKQYIQWLLAMRAFGLVSLSNGIVDFYKQLISMDEENINAALCNITDSGDDLKLSWLTVAIESNYVDVFKCLVESLVETGHSFSKNQRQSIICKAISSGQEEIINYFIEEVILGLFFNRRYMISKKYDILISFIYLHLII